MMVQLCKNLSEQYKWEKLRSSGMKLQMASFILGAGGLWFRFEGYGSWWNLIMSLETKNQAKPCRVTRKKRGSAIFF